MRLLRSINAPVPPELASLHAACVSPLSARLLGSCFPFPLHIRALAGLHGSWACSGSWGCSGAWGCSEEAAAGLKGVRCQTLGNVVGKAGPRQTRHSACTMTS